MKIGLIDVDSHNFPKLCLMKLSAYHKAKGHMQSVGITADNPQDFSIRGYSDDPEKHIALPYEMVCAADVDELNFLAARLEQLDPAEVGKLNAALQQKKRACKYRTGN